MKTIIVFLIVFSVVVVIHEFGHFFFARRSGILVREFAIGMGPKLFSHQGKDGTTYTIRAIPMGGYVRMAGYEDDSESLKAGMPLSLVLNEKNEVTTINLSKKIQLTNAIPIELTSFDLVDELYICGLEGSNANEATRYFVCPDAEMIEADGTKVRIAPRDVQFQSAKLWQRMLTNFAGPMNNFILTILLMILLAFIRGGVVDLHGTAPSFVAEDSPAQVAGLKAGDKILEINNQKVENWSAVQSLILENPDKELTLTVERGEKELTLKATPKAVESDGKVYGQLGISAPVKTGFLDKIIGGVQESWDLFIRILVALKGVFGNFSIDQLGGPVAIFQMSSEAASQGVITVIWFMAMISMNLGIFNLLPIPGLDGGKLLLNFIEAIRGKPISQEKEGIITLIGFGLMVLLMILVTWNDIQRFFF